MMIAAILCLSALRGLTRKSLSQTASPGFLLQILRSLLALDHVVLEHVLAIVALPTDQACERPTQSIKRRVIDNLYLEVGVVVRGGRTGDHKLLMMEVSRIGRHKSPHA